MTLPAGTSPPAPDEIDKTTGAIHAIDGDGTAVCTGGHVEQIDHQHWSDVPTSRRCSVCQVLAQ